jgi:hypothetical protein
MNNGEHLNVVELSEFFGQAVHVIGDLFQDTLTGLLKSKTVREHVKTNAAMSTLRHKIKSLRVRIDGDDEITLADIASEISLPVDFIATRFIAALNQRTSISRVGAS